MLKIGHSLRGVFFFIANIQNFYINYSMSFRFQKGEANDVILTVTEKSVLTSPFYLFQFTHDQSEDVYFCISTDTSLHPERYNKFLITDKLEPDPEEGEVAFNYPGFYTYKVYESEAATLDPTGLEIVEQGRMIVVDTVPEDKIYRNETDSIIYEQD